LLNYSKKSKFRDFQRERLFTKSGKYGQKMNFFQFSLHESSSRDQLDQKNMFSNLAGSTPLKYLLSGKPLIAPEPEVGKFQNWVEMKVNYPTNKETTPEDFSDNFRNIKKFVQVDHSKKIMKKRLIFSVCRSQKTAGGRKFFSTNKIKHI
jgi:hypothetical protein